jgi:hypothetical protein
MYVLTVYIYDISYSGHNVVGEIEYVGATEFIVTKSATIFTTTRLTYK